MPEEPLILAPARISIMKEALGNLTAARKTLLPKFYYDNAGCTLFDAITELPEYYPKRTERHILRARARAPHPILIEYGASNEVKAVYRP